MLVKTYCAAVNGLRVTTITIEVSITGGTMYHFTGLGDKAVKEGRDRVNAALQHNGFHFPKGEITVNMAPADLRKEGSAFDLPLAIGLLAASSSIFPKDLSEIMMVGELSLDGVLQRARGVLSIAMQAQRDGIRSLIVPAANGREAAVVQGLQVFGMHSLVDVINLLTGRQRYEPVTIDTNEEFYKQQTNFPLDFSEVRGQERAKRAMEVAAAGGHNIVMIGPPGSGKSMIAKRLPSILPPLTIDESLETTQIHSIAGILPNGMSLITQRPFRTAHHTASAVALVGGGSTPSPGEVSLAHNGVLFLDELPEFSKNTLEALRQPIEDRRIAISRVKYSIEYPCSFMFVASMNPCPCGYYGDPTHKCMCLPGQRKRYVGKISGPLMDRIDLQVEVQPVSFDELSQMDDGESSAAIRERVLRARAIQTQRFEHIASVHCNAQMDESLTKEMVRPTPEGYHLLRNAMRAMNLSARAYGRILKVSRTIADLEGSDNVLSDHINEAISYRQLDRADWGEW